MIIDLFCLVHDTNDKMSLHILSQLCQCKHYMIYCFTTHKQNTLPMIPYDYPIIITVSHFLPFIGESSRFSLKLSQNQLSVWRASETAVVTWIKI